MTRIRDSIAIVTGGASGIGLGIARALKDSGATVVVATPPAESDVDLDVTVLPVDVASASSVNALTDAVLSRFGRIDILVNNAGVGPAAPIAEMNLDDWRWLLDVNLWGVIHGVRAVLPGMLNNGSGHIVTVSSMSALAPMSPLGGYAVTKAGVTALSEVLARELDGTGVHLTTVFPGPTRTNIGQSLRNRAGGSGALKDHRITPPDELWKTPEEVGRMVRDAVARDEELLITHPELWPRVEQRERLIAEAFRRAEGQTTE
jgi:NAD(P)-dependent dehydrogenase (short-subunit alcohol dehydrogenase family)